MTRDQKIAGIVGAVILVTFALGVAAFLALRSVGPALVQTARSQFSEMATQLSDRELRTAVAQIELHKLRYGNYPRTLQELRYLSPFDQTILFHVDYFPSQELTAYYVESRGNEFVKAPKLEYPDEFWQGTGFRKELKPLAKPATDLPKVNRPLQPTSDGKAAAK